MTDEISFYTYLEHKIRQGMETDSGKGSDYFQILEQLPDFMGLLVRLVMDNRLSRDQRLYAASALVYLISPEDFIPERSFGLAGLVEDGLLVARTIKDLHHQRIDACLNEHWRGKLSLVDAVEMMVDNAPRFVDEEVLTAIELYLKTNRSVV